MFIYNLQEMAKSLQNEYQTISSKIEHNGLKGTMREDKLKEYIKKLFPSKYAIGNGIIVDSNETQSKQQDFIIYDNFNSPNLIETDSVQVIPIESVYATIEVKSTLTISELETSIKNIESVKKLEKTKPFINPVFSTSFTPPICMIFAYSSDTSLNNIVKKIDELNSDIEISNRLSIVCVLDKGLIFGINRHGFKEIELIPTEKTIYVTHEDKLENNLYLFYLLMITAINNIIMPPVNLMGYAQKIKKADYSGCVANDRIVPEDAYVEVDNGIKANVNLMRFFAKNFYLTFEKYQKGSLDRAGLVEFIAIYIYQLMFDSNFTGKVEESIYQPVNFLGLDISSNEIISVKKYYNNEIIDQIEKEKIEKLIDTLFITYKENIKK